MAGLNVNLNLMAGTAQRTDTIGDDMLGRTVTLLNGVREIRGKFSGLMGAAVNEALDTAEPKLMRMIDLLKPLASDTKLAVQTLSTEDQSGQTQVKAQVESIAQLNRFV